MSTVNLFIEQLVKDAPQLKALYDQPVSDNDELLPHVFMGDVTRFVARDDDLVALVGVSFVENLMGERKAWPKLKRLMRPRLRMEVEAVCGL